MTTREVILIVAVVISLFLAFSAIDVLNRYQKEKGMAKSQRLVLTYISILVPILGYILTRRLRKELS